MIIMISVLDNGTSKAILSRYMNDFDEYVYDFCVRRAKPSGRNKGEVSDSVLSSVEAEVIGGYLAHLRNVPNSSNGKGYLVEYQPELIDDTSRCKLAALSQVFLFGGKMGERQTVHFVGEEERVINILNRIVQNEERRGLISDVADCLDFCKSGGLL